MGGKDSRIKSEEDLLSHYKEVSRQQNGVILADKAVEAEKVQYYLLREYTFGSQIQFNMQKRRLDAEINNPKQNMLRVLKVATKEFGNICSSSYKIYALYEYSQCTLQDEIVAREQEGKLFEEGQLWSILQSCIDALSDLRPSISIHPTQLFLSKEGFVKMINGDLVEDTHRLVMTPSIYYAPQKLKNFGKADQDASLKREGVFSMGMTLLHTALCSNLEECYDYTTGDFFEDRLESAIQIAAERYSCDFIELLANVLQPNPNRRISLMEVQTMLNNYSKMSDCPEEEIPFKESNKSPKRNCQMLPTVVSDKKDTARLDIEREQLKNTFKQATYTESFTASEQKQYKTNYTPQNNENLFTDPRLLEMIKKDLADIGKLKSSVYKSTSKYEVPFTKAESLLSSMKRPPKESSPQQPSFYETFKTGYKMNSTVDTPVFVVQTDQSGSKYEGTTMNGMRHGRGRLTYQDGAYYQGEFLNGQISGKGILYYKTGHPAYEGQWFQDQFHGEGKLFNETPEFLKGTFDIRDFNEVQEYWIRYEGHFELDNKSGDGKLFLTNGEIIEGHFSEDCLDGIGVFTNLKGEKLTGYWENNILISIDE